MLQKYLPGSLILLGTVALIIVAELATSVHGDQYAPYVPAAMVIEIWAAALSYPALWMIWIANAQIAKRSKRPVGGLGLPLVLIIMSAVLDMVLFFRLNGAIDLLVHGYNRDLFPQYEELFLVFVVNLTAVLFCILYRPEGLARALGLLTPAGRAEVVERQLTEALGIEPAAVNLEANASPVLDDSGKLPLVNGEAKRTDLLEDLTLRWSDGHARLITKYYAQGYTQADLGFRYSLVFAVVGFLAILASSISGFVSEPHSSVVTVTTGASGGVSAAVSFLFFRRADKGRELMMSLVDKLRMDREKELNVLRSLDQLEKLGIGDAHLQNGLRTAATLQFLSSSVTLDQLAQFLRSSAPES